MDNGSGLYFMHLATNVLAKQSAGVRVKDIQMILRLFLVIAMYCQGSSSQKKSINQPLALLAGWEGSLGICRR